MLAPIPVYYDYILVSKVKYFYMGGYEVHVGWYSILWGLESILGKREFGEVRYDLSDAKIVEMLCYSCFIFLFNIPSFAYVKLKSLFMFGIDAIG